MNPQEVMSKIMEETQNNREANRKNKQSNITLYTLINITAKIEIKHFQITAFYLKKITSVEINLTKKIMFKIKRYFN